MKLTDEIVALTSFVSIVCITPSELFKILETELLYFLIQIIFSRIQLICNARLSHVQ